MNFRKKTSKPIDTALYIKWYEQKEDMNNKDLMR